MAAGTDGVLTVISPATPLIVKRATERTGKRMDFICEYERNCEGKGRDEGIGLEEGDTVLGKKEQQR
jgi:hypothetical protein